MTLFNLYRCFSLQINKHIIHNIAKPELRRVKELLSETKQSASDRKSTEEAKPFKSQSNGTEEEHGQVLTGWESDG